MDRWLLYINQFSDGMMSVMEGLLSSVFNMTVRMLRSRLKHLLLMTLSKLSLTTGATTSKKSTVTSKMNLISLNTSLEVGLSALDSKVSIP